MKTARIFNFEDEVESQYAESDNSEYLNKQVIMYSGRKKSLLNFIDQEVTSVKKRLNKDKLTILDGFSGSGIVSRILKKHSSKLYSNDLEYYSKIINECYLINKNQVDLSHIEALVNQLNSMSIKEHEPGFIEELYAPKDTHKIQIGERAFFTNENAKIIDNIRRDIDIIVEPELKPLLIAPLLAAITGRANVQNVFRAFYKDTSTNKGQWGGNTPKLIGKIFQRIILETPVLSDFNCESEIHCRDINELVKELPEVDLAYFDPPFDQYAYGENYFMFNLIAKYEKPTVITKGAGVPLSWNRSLYNSKHKSIMALSELISNTKAKYIMLTYDVNGIIKPSEIGLILNQFGKVEVKTEIRLNQDSINLYILEKESQLNG